MFKKTKINFESLAGYGHVGMAVSSLALVLLSSAIFLAPYMYSDKVAAIDDAGVPSAQAAVTPTVSIGLQDRIDLDITPTATGATSSASATLTVATTDSAGYSIYLSASDNNLRPVNSANTSVIAPATTGGVGTTIENLEANTWGYALTNTAPGADTLYQGISTSTTTPITTKDTSATNSANDTYILNIGTKVDSSLISGTYQGAILVSVVVTPRLATLSDIDYMQEMTTEICTNSTENETKQLIDARDGNSYWVAKLKDGNCWMTQNLDFNIPVAGLSSIDTNIATSWDASSSYPPRATSTSLTDGGTAYAAYTETYSWDLGKWVLSTPGNEVTCNSSVGLSDCTSAGFIDVSSSEWQPTFAATGTGASIQAVDESSKTYDAHYLVGNYYQWNAATAGTGGTITSNNATGSICPNGWYLPARESTFSSASNGGFYYLLAQYGISGGITGNIDASGQQYSVYGAPLYFTRGGNVIPGSRNNQIAWAGDVGAYWSTTATNSASYSYALAFSNFGLDDIYNVSNTVPRYYGLTVRCLAYGN